MAGGEPASRVVGSVCHGRPIASENVEDQRDTQTARPTPPSGARVCLDLSLMEGRPPPRSSDYLPPVASTSFLAFAADALNPSGVCPPL